MWKIKKANGICQTCMFANMSADIVPGSRQFNAICDCTSPAVRVNLVVL